MVQLTPWKPCPFGVGCVAFLLTQGAPKRRPWAREFNRFAVKTTEPLDDIPFGFRLPTFV
jgi:hypothetical protein